MILGPNISGEFIVFTRNLKGENEGSGAFSVSDGGGQGESYNYAGKRPKFIFNALAYNSIYDCNTVQPYAGYSLIIIKA